MKCAVVGAGNAGRPVARILNYVGHQVQITDQKTLEELPLKSQEILLQMEKEGVELNLGLEVPVGLENVDSAYLSPTIPEESPIRKNLSANHVDLIGHEDISRILDDLVEIDMIGVTGTLGKTSTTHIVSQIFESAGYEVWKCSSRHGNLLSEVIIDGIVKGYHAKNDIAVFELPHGTSRLMSRVKLKIGVLTNIYPDHLDEFEDSMEKYAERKLFIADSSEILISTPKCREYLESLRNDVIYYCPLNGTCDVSGRLEDGRIYINYDLANHKVLSPLNSHEGPRSLNNHESPCSPNNHKGSLKTSFKLLGYYFENSIAAAAVALSYGLDENAIKKGLTGFKGISGHMEYLGMYCGREIHFDAAFVPEGLVATLEQFSNRRLLVLVDNPDTTTVRDKFKIGSVVGEYADILISSGYNETLGGINMEAAHEVLRGVQNEECQKIAVEDMKTAGEISIKISNPGDTILHVGPGAITNYDDLKQKMLRGIEEGCKKYG